MHLDVRKNFEEKVSYVARNLNGMVVDDQATFLVVDCGLPSDTFNVIVLRDLRVSAEMQASCDRFISKGFPFAVWGWESAINNADLSHLTQQGLVHTETHRAMYADLSSMQLASLPVEGLEIKQATTAGDLLYFGEVISDLFGDSSEGRQVLTYFEHLCSYPLSMFPDLRYYVGTFQGKAVAIGTLFVGSQTVGIYDIVTHDDYRRRGIGSAMFQRLLKDALTTNRRFAVLQASPDGLGIYLKAGFKVTGDVLTFERRDIVLNINTK